MKYDGTPLYTYSQAALRGIWDLFTGCEAYGMENVPANGPFLLACNHASFLDPPVFGAYSPRALHYFARKTLFIGPFGKLIRKYNAIPIDRDGQSDLHAFREVFKVLKSGGCLLVFPEGTRTSDGRLQTARPGLGMIAARAGVPIVPARIHGSFRIYSRHRKLPDLLNPMSVVFGRAIDPATIDPGKNDPDRFRKISQAVLDKIAELKPEPHHHV